MFTIGIGSSWDTDKHILRAPLTHMEFQPWVGGPDHRPRHRWQHVRMVADLEVRTAGVPRVLVGHHHDVGGEQEAGSCHGTGPEFYYEVLLGLDALQQSIATISTVVEAEVARVEHEGAT